MQQCRVRGVRSVELAATNFEEAGRFYESVWGLRPVEARDGVQLYRGTAAYHHIVGLHRGPRPGAHAHRVRRGRPRRRRRASSRDRGGGRPRHRSGDACRRRRRLWFRLHGSGRPQPRLRVRLRRPCRRTGHDRPAAPDRPRQSQRPGFRCQLPLLHPDARLSTDRRECAALVPALRQFRAQLHRARQDRTCRRSITSPSRCRTSTSSCAAWAA